MLTPSPTAALAHGAETKACETKSDKDSLDSRFDKWQCPKCDITVIWFKNVPESIDTTVQFISAHVLSDCAPKPEPKAGCPKPEDGAVKRAILELVKQYGEIRFHYALEACATKCFGKCAAHYIVENPMCVSHPCNWRTS